MSATVRNERRGSSVRLLLCLPATWSEGLVQCLDVLFNPDGALLEVGLARDGVESTERHEIGVGFGKVEGHEDLTRGNDAGDAEFEVA